MIHPFHPWCGREFVLVAVRHTWGEDRGFFLGEDEVQKSLPRAWTDAADPDVFVALAEGRSSFRVEDLLALAALVPARPGPRRAHKLTEDFVAFARGELQADPTLRAANLADAIAERFGIRVHPRSVERALARAARPKSGGAR